MTFLHIEHPITDLTTWISAFATFTEMRRQAGVRSETVRHPENDQSCVVVDLEFDTSDQAHAFLHVLETKVWAIPENSPALAGRPAARLLETVDLGRISHAEVTT
jgi:hypothetical protein